MITFLVCISLLVVSYFTYGKYLERLFGADRNRPAPSQTHFDGVDYIPMPQWKTFLIQLLNIAGLGPIFGAVLGATYGPVAFVWITLGGIFLGAVQDYFSGMISCEHRGLSFTEIAGIYLGRSLKGFIRIFTVLLMVLVGAVFLVGPAGILSGMTGWEVSNWVWVILVYYILATLLPIDKIIGNIYPVFGAALLFMALRILGALFWGDYTIPELTPATFTNMKTDAAAFPIVPTLFITIACGAISGFHATQSPMMARCMRHEKQGRGIFFGAMISESIIALIWAAIGMAFFGGVRELNTSLAEHGNNAAWAVDLISKTTLGRVGGLLALLGVVAAPISTGDTAFRSARLMVADFLKLEQRTLVKRLWICIPLFLVGFAITRMQFDVIWRYFAWANQTLAVATLWTTTVYLARRRRNFYVALIPALFMTFITSDYLFTSPQMLGLGYSLGTLLAGGVCAATLLFFIKSNKSVSQNG